MAENDLLVDDRVTAALARLTEKEKDCLRRRLRHQTAKEMALDLAISPFAVEKRLKMARAKLGVSSSLEAARWLAEFERYQRSGSQSPDLASGSGDWDEAQRSAAPRSETMRAQSRRTAYLVSGGIVMSLMLAAALAFALQSSDAATADVPTDEQGRPTSANGRPIIYETYDAADMVKPRPAEIAAVVTTTFSIMDQDHSGFIEPDETPVAGNDDVVRKIYTRDKVGKVIETGKTVKLTAEQARRQYIEMGDKNGDGKLDFAEYRDWMAPITAKRGIPAEWRKDIEEHYRPAGD